MNCGFHLTALTTLSVICCVFPCVAQSPKTRLEYDAFATDPTVAIQLDAELLRILNHSKDRPDYKRRLRCETADEIANRGPEPQPQLYCTRMPPSFHTGENFIVFGDGELSGNHASPIWILHRDRQGAKLIFYGGAGGITLGPRRTNGYPDIEGLAGVGGMTYTEKFRFDGRRYMKISHVEEPTDDASPASAR